VGRMDEPGMTAGPKELHKLVQSARVASDEQLLRLVALLDRLPVRGEADRLIEAARPRLRGRMPERPLNLTRLLFLPVEPLLTSPRDWRGEVGRVPRHAIIPLTDALRLHQPKLVPEVEQALAGRSATEVALCSALGERVWPAAAAAIAAQIASGPPPGWAATGLPASAHVGLAGTCAAIWRHATGLWQLRLAGPDGPPEAMVRPVFRALAAEGLEAAGLGLSVLLPYAARPSLLISTVNALDRALGPTADAALDRYLEGVVPPDGLADLATTGQALARFVALIEDLDDKAGRNRPRRAEVLHALRARAADVCTTRVAAEAEIGLWEPLQALLQAESVDDAAVEALEGRASALRAMADAGRRLRPSGSPDATMARVLARLGGIAMSRPRSGAGFLQADALRLLQILAGPGEAMRLLRGG
jgi:hypothetical protein